MRLSIVVVIGILLVVACTPQHSVESPIIIEVNDSDGIVFEENTSLIENETVEDGLSPELVLSLNQQCVRKVEFEIEDVCADGDNLRLELENTGSVVILHFEVWVRDRFEESFVRVPDVSGLGVGGSGTRMIPAAAFDERPYLVRIKPVVMLEGVEFSCTPSTEFYETSRDEFARC